MSWVYFNPVDPIAPGLLVPLDEVGAKLSSAATWNAVARPRRRAVAEFGGWPLDTMTIGLMLDGFRDNIDQEPPIAQLYSFMNTPNILGIGGVVPLTGQKLWTMTTIEQGDDIRRQGDGHRIRARLTVTVQEYIPPDLQTLAAPSPAAAAVDRAAPTTGGGGRTYTVKRGDTLSVIAQRELGNANRWHEIADLNGIRDPRTLQVGQVLRLP